MYSFFLRSLRPPFFITLLTIAVFSTNLSAQFSGGEGARTNPFQISSSEELQNIREFPGSHYIQISDINAGDTKNWNEGKGFEPIGGDSSAFTGTYDGNGFVISGLTINRENREYVGLFGFTQNSEIKRVIIKEAETYGSNNTGILAGKLVNGAISDSKVEGIVNGRTYVGGLVGFNFGMIERSGADVQVSGRSYTGGVAGINRGEVVNSTAEGEVTGSANGIGGLVGNNYDGSIRRSHAKAEVSGSNSTAYGGLVGSNGGKILFSYATGKVMGRSHTGGLAGLNRGLIRESFSDGEVHGKANGTGGLVGNNVNGEISRSYSSSKVKGVAQVGGLVGINKNDGRVEESYTSGAVQGAKDVGGFIGLQDKARAAGYWNTESSNQAIGVGNGGSNGITGLTTSEMTGTNSQENMSDFAFDFIWGTVTGAPPKLLWAMPYFNISSVETNSPIRSGEIFMMDVLIENTGGLSDTSNVLLINDDGEIIDSVANLYLEGGSQASLFFEWQSSALEKGKSVFTIQTKHDQKDIEADVRFIPQIVRLEGADNIGNYTDVQPQLYWEEAAFTEYYRLQISEDATFDSVITEIDSLETLTHKPKEKLNHETTYFWRVRGENAEETGEWSKIRSFTTVVEKPDEVTLVAPENEAEGVPASPTLTWETAQRADRYHIQLARDEEFEIIAFDTTLIAPDTSYTFTEPLQANQTFYWRVSAENDGGTSGWPDPYQFIPEREYSQSRFSNLEYRLDQNYPNPFNNVTQIRYTIPEASEVRIEVLNMLGQNVATLVNEYKSAGRHTVTFDASDLSSGFYIYTIQARQFEASKKLTLIK